MTEQSPASAMTKYRWLVCALLFFATTINYIDRQILSLIKEILDRDLGWSNTEFGLVNSAFQLAYAVGLVGFGWLVDKYGTKKGYALSIAAWSLAAAAHAVVVSMGGFLVARVALGLGEGGNFPSAIKAVAQWFPKKERALATSLFNSGSNVAAIVAPAIVPVIAFTWGWQAAFVLAGVAGLAWLALWFPLYDTPDRLAAPPGGRVSAAELDHIRSDCDTGTEEATAIPWISLLRYRATWAFIVAKLLTDPIWWFFLIWLPDYFKATRDLDIKKSWYLIGTIYFIITVLSIVGGWLTGYLANRGWTVTRARKTGMILFALLVLPIFAVTHVGNWPAAFLIALAGAAHQAWSANLFTTVSDMFPRRAVASVVGLGGTAGACGGAAFPLLCGWLLDDAAARGNATAGYAVLFAICGTAYVVAFALHHLLAPSLEPVKT